MAASLAQGDGEQFWSMPSFYPHDSWQSSLNVPHFADDIVDFRAK